MDHLTLKYLVNKIVLEGRIYHWLLLFHEFSFEVIVKPRWTNFGPNHLSQLESCGSRGSIDDQFSDVDLFRIKYVLNYLEDIVYICQILVAINHCTIKLITSQCFISQLQGSHYIAAKLPLSSSTLKFFWNSLLHNLQRFGKDV